MDLHFTIYDFTAFLGYGYGLVAFALGILIPRVGPDSTLRSLIACFMPGTFSFLYFYRDLHFWLRGRRTLGLGFGVIDNLWRGRGRILGVSQRDGTMAVDVTVAKGIGLHCFRKYLWDLFVRLCE